MSGKSKVVELSRSTDQRKAITDAIGDISKFKIFNNQILVGIYIEPETTAGGIILPQSRAVESKFQGKIGLVLKKGPLAFKDDDSTRFYDQDVDVGEWIFFRPSDGWHFQINSVDCRLIEDVHVKGSVPHPKYIW